VSLGNLILCLDLSHEAEAVNLSLIAHQVHSKDLMVSGESLRNDLHLSGREAIARNVQVKEILILA